MKNSHILLVLILSAAIAFGVVKLTAQHSSDTPVQESAYDRVLRTGELRCGYAFWPKVFMKDPQTGEFTGIVYDVMQAIGDKLYVKIVWAEETGWSNYIESLKTHRIDAMCSSIWRNAERGRYTSFVTPMFYNAIYPYVAEGDHRFDKDLSIVDNPDIHISTMDGEMSDVIAKAHFSKATKVSVPQLGQSTDILMNVATHKADIVFTSSDIVGEFIKANPHSIRAAQDTPFQVFPAAIPVDIHETQLHDMIDSAMVELHNQGIVEEILTKYQADPKDYLRLAKPYAAVEK